MKNAADTIVSPAVKSISLAVISLAMFMESVDSTILNTAIPAMSKSLNVNPIDLKIALISYLLSLAILIPISGWVADKFGVKRVFVCAMGLFTLSSIWCGFAHNLPELIMARCLQGCGGSLMLPVGRLVVLRTIDRTELINAMSKIVIMASFGPMVGPFLGGIITTHLSWRWVFWVNIPVGIFTIALAWRWLIDWPAVNVPPLDKWGFVLFGSGLASLAFGLSTLSQSTMTLKISLLILASSLLFLFCYGWHSRSQAHPIIKTELLGLRTFRTSVLGNLWCRTGIGGVAFLLPLLLQISLGYSAQMAGFLLTPTALGLMTVKLVVQKVLKLLGYRRFLIFNTLALGLSVASFSLIDQHSSLWFIAALTYLFGCLLSAQFTGMNSLAFADVPKEKYSAATSIASTNQQLAMSFGVAISALLLRTLTADSSYLNLSVAVFHRVFWSLGVVTALAIIIFSRLKKEDGQQLI